MAVPGRSNCESCADSGVGWGSRVLISEGHSLFYFGVWPQGRFLTGGHATARMRESPDNHNTS
jgi:hypothetical protein